MTGTSKADAVPEHGPGTVGPEDRVAVDWNVRTRRHLASLGLAASVSGHVDVVVVDRRGGETTPGEPGELTVEGRRVVVVPDRSEGRAPVDVWVAGGRDRYGRVVRTLRRTVAFDAAVDAAFEAARRRSHRAHGDDPSADAAQPGRDIEATAGRFGDLDTRLAVGGFAAAVDPIW